MKTGLQLSYTFCLYINTLCIVVKGERILAVCVCELVLGPIPRKEALVLSKILFDLTSLKMQMLSNREFEPFLGNPTVLL